MNLNLLQKVVLDTQKISEILSKTYDAERSSPSDPKNVENLVGIKNIVLSLAEMIGQITEGFAASGNSGGDFAEDDKIIAQYNQSKLNDQVSPDDKIIDDYNRSRGY